VIRCKRGQITVFGSAKAEAAVLRVLCRGQEGNRPPATRPAHPVRRVL
jgi:hypothetical protein